MDASKSYKSEKLKFYNWILKWACSDYLQTNIDEVPEDIPQIASILQAMGYKLETIEYPQIPEDKNDKNDLKIEVHCRKSGLKAVLTKDGTDCSCPNPQTDAKLWTVRGCGPSASQDHLNRIDETYSSLVPVLSKDISQIIKDVLTKMFSMTKETDVNQNKNNSSSGDSSKLNFSRTRSLDIITRKPELKRQGTWEVDPKTSPPIKTSSPIPELCKSIDQMHLQADKEQMLTEILHNMQDNLEKALILLPKENNTFTKKLKKRVSDIQKISPTPTHPTVTITPTRSTCEISTPDMPTRKTPIKPTNPKKPATTTISSLKTDKRFLGIRSKIGSIRKKSDTETPVTSRPQLTKKDTPYPRSMLLSPNVKNEGKLAASTTFNKSANLRGSNSNLSQINNNSTLTKSNISPFGLKPSANKTGMLAPLKVKQNNK